ncbi:putative transglutaminase-like cysteine proteinase [Sinorhizobium fredii]
MSFRRWRVLHGKIPCEGRACRADLDPRCSRCRFGHETGRRCFCSACFLCFLFTRSVVVQNRRRNGEGRPRLRQASELSRVNVAVNTRFKERSDRGNVGKDDDWRVPARYGDCEDFTIAKKRELLKRGWPASALLLTVARSRSGGHTVLTVRTSKGDLVLDNQTNAVRDWWRTPLRLSGTPVAIGQQPLGTD